MLEAAVYHHEDAENRFAELGIQTTMDNRDPKTGYDYSPAKKQTQAVTSNRSISQLVSNRSMVPLSNAGSGPSLLFSGRTAAPTK
jgi:hypothetical protein